VGWSSFVVGVRFGQRAACSFISVKVGRDNLRFTIPFLSGLVFVGSNQGGVTESAAGWREGSASETPTTMVRLFDHITKRNARYSQRHRLEGVEVS
jgi:hypothetical protein